MNDATLSGLVTLIAVGAGALSSFLVTRAVEKLKWQRELNARWDAQRLTVYTEYAAAVKMAIIRSRSILGYMKLSPTLTPISPEEGLPLLALDENSRSFKLESVMLLASQDVIDAARAWHGIAWTFQHWASGARATTSDEVEAEYEKAQTAREAFYEAARRELRVSPTDK